MEKLRELADLARELGAESWVYRRNTPYSRGYITGKGGRTIVQTCDGEVPANVCRFIEMANPETILAIAEAFRELELAHCGGSLLERELHHVEVVKEILKRNSELEARLAEREPDGWKMVPINPTKEMVTAGQDKFEECIDHGFDSCEDGSTHEYSKISSDAPYQVFKAMIAAAPKVEK